jgi:uncharacterized membrane protein YgcG
LFDKMMIRLFFFLLGHTLHGITHAEDASTTWQVAFEKLSDHLHDRAPLLLLNDIPEDESGGYVGDLLSRYGHDQQILDNIMTAIDVKYGNAAVFKNGWLTSKQKHVLVSQFTAFYTSMGVDQPDRLAIDKLAKCDRTSKRNEAFDEADNSPKDERLSVEEIKVLFRRRPKVRRDLFVLPTDDKLHNVTSEDRADFSLLRYDSDGDHYVTRAEFLHDDLSIQSLMLSVLNEHLGSCVQEWIDESQQISMICISPENCWYEGDATDIAKKEEKKMAGYIDETVPLIKKTVSKRPLADQVKEFYGGIAPDKVATASKTAQRWADDPTRLHAALIKRYFKESVHEWWSWLISGKMIVEIPQRPGGGGGGGGAGGGGPGGGGQGGGGPPGYGRL